MTDRISNKIYETKNYDKFVPFKGNRGHTTAHVRKLAESMKTCGWIDSLPMSVKRDKDGTLRIVDGHNRLAAAKATGTPAKYSVINGEVSDNDIYQINRTQRRWTTLDYIKSYARIGYPEYVKVANFIERHKCGAPIACSLLANQPSVSNSLVQSGDFKVFDEELADQMIGWLKQINAAVKVCALKSHFNRVFVKACNIKQFKPQRFVSQVIKRPNMFVDYHRQEDLAKMMEEIYNYGYQSGNRIPLSFLISQA